jgi:hypothetical protein
MDAAEYGIERPLFYALYKAIVGEAFSLADFDTDDLYASKVFERALESENFELRNLAAHLQAHRQSEMEVITLKAPERLDRTWKNPTISFDVMLAPPPPPAPEPELAPGAPRPERRSTMARFTPQEIVALATLQRLFRKEFGKAVDAEEFASNDPYGRQVLRESLASSNLELVAAAKSFMDDEGRFRRHRRGPPDSGNLAGAARR